MTTLHKFLSHADTLPQKYIDDVAPQHLKQLISDISEDLWCAGWLRNVEHKAWTWVTGSGRKPERVGVDELAALKKLSTLCNGWLSWMGDERGVEFVPMDQWLDIHEQWRIDKGQTVARIN